MPWRRERKAGRSGRAEWAGEGLSWPDGRSCIWSEAGQEPRHLSGGGAALGAYTLWALSQIPPHSRSSRSPVTS